MFATDPLMDLSIRMYWIGMNNVWWVRLDFVGIIQVKCCPCVTRICNVRRMWITYLWLRLIAASYLKIRHHLWWLIVFIENEHFVVIKLTWTDSFEMCEISVWKLHRVIVWIAIPARADDSWCKTWCLTNSWEHETRRGVMLLFMESSYLVDPASSHMLFSKTKPCMSKYKQVCTVKLRMAH